MPRSRLEAYFGGRVQGVGFRYTTKRLATGYEVAGTVRNLPDGRVELSVEGDKSELEAFLEGIRKSEVGRFIEKEECFWGPATGGFRGFEIAR